MPPSASRLPKEPADRLTAPFMRFLRIEAMAGAALFLATLLAIATANSPLANLHEAIWSTHVGIVAGGLEFGRTLKEWVNEGLMTLFFFVIALELKRELVLGDLRDPHAAAFPVAAAVGGMAVPAALFLVIAGDGPGGGAWGVVMSTDTAFVIGCLAVLRDRVPTSLRLFLLALAIVDDIGAILVVAIAYGESLNAIALALAGTGLLVVAGAARLGVRPFPFYFALGGGIWLALDASGLHATMAGVILGLMTPARSWVSDVRLHAILDRVVAQPPGRNWAGDKAARADLHRAGVATREALSPIEQLETALHPWVAFGVLPLFALANAGIPLEAANHDPALLSAVVVGFVVGKPVGVLVFSLLVVRLGVGLRPPDLSWPLLAAGAMLTGIGFTMALFIADLAVGPDLAKAVKAGILGASVLSAVFGFSVIVWATSNRRRRS